MLACEALYWYYCSTSQSVDEVVACYNRYSSGKEHTYSSASPRSIMLLVCLLHIPRSKVCYLVLDHYGKTASIFRSKGLLRVLNASSQRQLVEFFHTLLDTRITLLQLMELVKQCMLVIQRKDSCLRHGLHLLLGSNFSMPCSSTSLVCTITP